MKRKIEDEILLHLVESPKLKKIQAVKYQQCEERNDYVKRKEYLPLNMSIDEILPFMKKCSSSRFPGLRACINPLTNSIFCDYHKQHGYFTDRCVSLKDQIKKLICEGSWTNSKGP